jgi:CheY-like chemotaxis protein
MARPRVLVVDDEKEVRQVIAEVMEMDGLYVQTASNGVEALALLNREVFDLIYCDLNMPEMDGVEFYEAIRRDHPGLLKRVVFVTAKGGSPEYGPFLRESGVLVLEKPVTLQQLRQMTVRMVGPTRRY